MVARHNPRHPRCGTNFLFLVMAVSILVFVFLGRPDTLLERLVRFLFIPVIGGIAYELTRLSGLWADKSWAQPLLWPGLTLQYITTKYPSTDQIEVAIRSLQAVLDPAAVPVGTPAPAPVVNASALHETAVASTR
jgi:uncharacterized protein YqhQ